MVETKKSEACTPGFQHTLCLRLFWQRANQHDHLATFHFWHIFNPAQFLWYLRQRAAANRGPIPGVPSRAL